MVERPAGAGSAAASSNDAEPSLDSQWKDHPTVNTDKPCPWCGIRALHEQHCKQICLACGWYQSCVD